MTSISASTTFIKTLEKAFPIGAWFAILFCFSIASLGTAITTISSIAAVILWSISLKYTEYIETLKKHPFSFVAFILFIYLGISLLWSEHLTEGLSIWKKYREFIFIPIFLIYFSNTKNRGLGLYALYIGMSIAVIISYLVYFDIFPFKPKQHSIGNHIFNGILISFFSYWSLSLAFNHKKYWILFITLYAASFFTLFFIREGRTGYVLFVSLMVLFIFQNFKWKNVLTFFLLTSFIIVCLYYQLFYSSNISPSNTSFFENFHISYFANLDIRLEYYINTLRIIINNWGFGVGTGDFSSLYLETSNTYDHFWPPTVNPHNEYLMIMVQSGIIGLTLFLIFFFYLFQSAIKLPKIQAQQSIAVIITIAISCLFNSSFLDNQDGSLFLVLISLFFSSPLKPNLPE